MENNLEQTEILKPNFNKEEVTGFLKNSLPQILKIYFTEPVTGTYNLFKNTDNKVYQNSIVLISVTAILYILVPYLLAGDMREYIPFSGFLKIGLGIVLFQIMVTIVSFGVKSITGKPNFKSELLTGALCGIPLCVLLSLTVLGKLFISNLDITDMLNLSGITELRFLAIPAIFIPLLLINTLIQSFRASNVKENLGWYSAPIALGIAVVLTRFLIVELFFN